MGARARLGRPALVALGLLVASAVVFQFVRSRIGVGFSSDSYSYLAWAERFLSEGKLGHTPYDFTAPKPLELAVATLGEAVGEPVGVFGTWAVLSYLGAVLAVAALAKHFAGWPAAAAAGVLVATMPALIRAGWAGDSTVPYAACVVGAAAFADRIRPAAVLLGVAGLLRPEAWDSPRSTPRSPGATQVATTGSRPSRPPSSRPSSGSRSTGSRPAIPSTARTQPNASAWCRSLFSACRSCSAT